VIEVERQSTTIFQTAISKGAKAMLSRRNILATAAAGTMSATAVRAAGFDNPDQPPEGSVNVTNPKALVDPGPQDPGLAGNEAAFQNPPATRGLQGGSV
jgi:hypothetical protein